MQIIFFIIHIVLLVTGVLIHLSTYFFIDLSKVDIIVKLWFVLVFLLTLTMLGYNIVKVNLKGNRRDYDLFKLLGLLPKWLSWSITLFFVITIIIFLYNGTLFAGGTTIIDGRYFLAEKGVVLKELTHEEYVYCQFIELRGISSMWLLMNYLSTVGYFYTFRKGQPLVSESKEGYYVFKGY
ncbi:MAG: hypothetical protein BGO41_01685 [Clostridiales bacterium 38-18]|nr:MAG: hypothetical protein BGO41_01685 [Clostridiales bacterium 38-18]